jgi:hypothetical protein
VGVQHPPIPADNAAWKHDAGGFVGNHFFYGERSWADVRMRVVGHIATVARDRSRWYAGRGEFKRAAAIQTAAAKQIRGVDTGESENAAQMSKLWGDAAERDATLLADMAAGALSAAILERPGRVFPARVAMVQLALRGESAPTADKTRWAAAVEALKAQPPPADLDLDDFADFDARHRLRVRLLTAYIDAVDPVGYSEPWGYWDGAVLQDTAESVAKAGEILSGQDWWKAGLRGPPYTWASKISKKKHKPLFSLIDLGGMPTGDSLIDVAGEPGPKSIGKLERLGMNDAVHVAWLHEYVRALNEDLEGDVAAVVEDIDTMVSALDIYTHGSRYYNIKQVRNAGVRQLARAGRPDLALRVLRGHRPLHHQDWACPNRAGILLAIEGRLLAVSEAKEAPKVLRQAADAATAFLADVDRVAAGG